MSKDQPLVVSIEGDQVVIRIGVETLAYAVERSDYFLDGDGKVTNAALFAKEVVNALQEEEEDGTNLVHAMFDQASQNAVEGGADGVEFSDSE